MNIKFFSAHIFFIAVSFVFFSCATTSANFYDGEIASYRTLDCPLENTESVTNINGEFPDEISIKTRTQTFAKGFSFTLHEGKIYVKAEKDRDWHLFLETGLPHPKMQLGGFEVPEKIAEISADGDVFVAFDENGVMYECYLQRNHFEKPFQWKTVFGFPKNSPLVQNVQTAGKRGWAIAARRKDVLWYTDIFGNDHHYGTMGLESVYVLAENGQEILFTDSGLPTDWSKSLLGPERGSFISENISASGSTIFLINKAGEMYTRLIDFDTMGSDPMWFKYTYKPYKQKYSGKNYLSNYTPWGLPNEAWKKQPPIVLEDGARISRYVTIFQTGHGNDARTLRVAGTDKDGNTGYYEKTLTAEKWEFVPKILIIPENDFFEPVSDENAEGVRGEKLEHQYSGFLAKNGIRQDGISISINDLPLTSEGDCKLIISDGENSAQILLYLVEMWTYTARFSPGKDGTPRYYFATPCFAENEIKREGRFGEILADLFEGKNLSIFSFIAEATDIYFEMGIENKKSGNSYKVFLTKDGKTEMHPTLFKISQFYTQSMIKNYDDAQLKLDSNKVYTNEDFESVQRVIENNKYFRDILQGEMDSYNKLRKNTTRTRWGYKLADLVTSITLLDQINFPKIKNLTSYGDTILGKQAEKYKAQTEYRMQVFPPVLALTQARINEYTGVLEKISKADGSAVVSGSLKDSYCEYFESIGLPKKFEGTLLYDETAVDATVQVNEAAPLFPGFFCRSLTGEISELFEILVSDSPEKIASNQKNNVKLKVQYIIIDENDLSKKIRGMERFSKKRGLLEWNGEVLKLFITELREDGKTSVTRLLFEGKAGIDDLTDNE